MKTLLKALACLAGMVAGCVLIMFLVGGFPISQEARVATSFVFGMPVGAVALVTFFFWADLV